MLSVCTVFKYIEFRFIEYKVVLCTALTFWTLWWHQQKQQMTLKGDFYKASNDNHLLESTFKWALSKHIGLWQPCFLPCTGAMIGQGWECLWQNRDFFWHLTAGTALTKQCLDLRMKPASTRGHLNKILWRKQPGAFKDKPSFFYCSSMFLQASRKTIKKQPSNSITRMSN